MSRIGRKPLEIPKGVQVVDHQGQRVGQGPQGHAHAQAPQGRSRSSRRRTTTSKDVIVFERKGNAGPVRAAHGLMRALVGNMLTGVTDGLHARRSRSTASATRPRSRATKIVLVARLLAPDRVHAARGHHGEGRQEHADPVGHRPARRSAPRRRRSAASARPSPTRARASSTWRRRSSAKRARPQVSDRTADPSRCVRKPQQRPSAGESKWLATSKLQPEGPQAAPPQGHDPPARHRHRRASAPQRVPLGALRLRRRRSTTPRAACSRRRASSRPSSRTRSPASRRRSAPA